jgi:hypothetical protein
MARPVEEFDLQKAWALWYGGEKWAAGPLIGQWKIQPAQLPGVIWWHTPNGGSRDVREGARLKQIGVKAGVHDILILWGGIRGLEFKRPGGKQPPERQLSPAQQAMHPAMLAAGMVASATVDTLELAKAQVRAWGLVAAGH